MSKMDPTKKKELSVKFEISCESIGDLPAGFFNELFDEYVAYVKDELPFVLEISGAGNLRLCLGDKEGYRGVKEFDPIEEIDHYNYSYPDEINFLSKEIIEKKFIGGYKNLIKKSETAIKTLQSALDKREGKKPTP